MRARARHRPGTDRRAGESNFNELLAGAELHDIIIDDERPGQLMGDEYRSHLAAQPSAV